MNLFLPCAHTRALAQERSFTRRIFFPSPIAVRVPLRAQPRVPSSLRCCPPNISSILTDHDEVFELPGCPGRAGSLINRPVTSHHSRLQASPHRLPRFAASVRDDRTLGNQSRPAT